MRFLFAAFLLCCVWSMHPAFGKAVISVGMPFSQVEKLLYQYGAVPLWIGVSSPIDDIFPSYRLVDGRIFSIYGQKIADRSWTVSFIDEIKPIPFKSNASYYYRRVTDLPWTSLKSTSIPTALCDPVGTMSSPMCPARSPPAS